MDDHFLTAQELAFGTELAATTAASSDGTTAVELPIQPSAPVAVATSNNDDGDAGPKIIYLDRVCRTCLVEKPKDQLKDLFEFGLAETVMACVSINLEESDGLPCHICMDCLQEVERIINFWQLCERSDASIRSLIEKSVVINQDSETKYEVLNVVLTDANGNTETSAVVVPIEELRFQLVNGGQSTSATPQDTIPVAGLAKPLELPTQPTDNNIQITIPGKNMQLNLAIPSEAVDSQQSTVNPSELLNETASNSLQENHIKDDQQQQQESTILLNIRQELSEFIGGGTSGSSSTDITKNPELDDNDDDEMIHVDYLKDALTEEYIQIMEEQLASSVPRSDNPLQDQLEQENLDSLINNDPAAMAAESVVAGEHTADAEAHSGLINGLHCAVCNITFDSEKMYQKHQDKHSEGLFNCNHCPRQFTDKNQFDVHQRRHSVNARPHCCETCGKRFGTRSLLNTHNKSHLGEKDHVCTVCGKGFTLPWQLKAHSRIHTNEKPFECPYCQKRFNQNGNLMIHIRIHTGEKPFQCSLCEKAFSAQGELIGHMRQHTGEKKVKKVVCTVCEKTFASKGDLNIHMRSHTKERPYGCQLCGKAFMLHVHLTVHMRSHTGEKPFACTLCEKAFPTNHQLKNHSHVHTGEKNYACDVCNRRFSTSANRNTHRKMHDRKIS